MVDDGSIDCTAQIVTERSLEDPRVRLVQHESNKGYGEALRTGFSSARLEHVFFTDADRIDRQDPFIRRFFAGGWNILVRVLFYVPVRDIDCAFKLFRRSVFDRIELESVGAMVNTELMVRLARSGASVVEVGVSHLPRHAGRASGANPKVIVRALRELWRMHERLKTIEAGTARPPR